MSFPLSSRSPMRLAALVAPLLSSVQYSADATRVNIDLRANECGGIQQALVENGKKSDKTVVYQCIQGQSWGGWGDRLAGLFGAAALSLQLDASLKIEMTGLDSVFTSPGLDWTYNPSVLKVAEKDVHLLQTKNLTRKGPRFPSDSFSALSEDLALFDDSDNNQGIDEEIHLMMAAKKRVIFVRGNRAHDWNYLLEKKVNWPKAWERCVFNALFSPATNLLDSKISLMTSKPSEPESRSMRSLVDVMQDRQTFSLAAHFRMHSLDQYNQDPADYTLPTERLQAVTKQFGCIEQLLEKASGSKKVLIVASDSNFLGRLAREHFQGNHGVSEVWVQSLTGPVHVAKASEKEAQSSLVQALQMWWLMHRSGNVVFGWPAPKIPSGFSMSAALMGHNEQKHIFADSCQPEPNQRSLGAGRFYDVHH